MELNILILNIQKWEPFDLFDLFMIKEAVKLHPISNLTIALILAGIFSKSATLPFHTWLPDAHPAAPSHVSGVMSGVMIKMGIYGIVRVRFGLF